MKRFSLECAAAWISCESQHVFCLNRIQPSPAASAEREGVEGQEEEAA